jgi:four helix bundle protein
MGHTSFTDLEVYKECRTLRINISNLVKNHFPQEEKYKLSDQIIRCSRRITACIAEGYGRFYYQENIQYCRMARGSLMETLEHLITAFDETYITKENLMSYKTHIDTCGKLINGYINYLNKTKRE